MKTIGEEGKDYLEKLSKRKKTSRAYREYQLIGLEVAQILDDQAHKSLYIKLTKQHGKSKILALAKSVADRKNVKNKGAYFMKLLHNPEKTWK